MTQIKQINTERHESTKIAANMSSLTGFLFANDYNANPVIGKTPKELNVDNSVQAAGVARGKASTLHLNYVVVQHLYQGHTNPVIGRSEQLKANKIHFQLSIKDKGKTCEAVRAGTIFNKSNYMNESLKGIKQYNDYSERTMETRDHSKNGASLKSHTSRGNFKSSTKG